MAIFLNFPIDYSLRIINARVVEGYIPEPAKKRPTIIIVTFYANENIPTPNTQKNQDIIMEIFLPFKSLRKLIINVPTRDPIKIKLRLKFLRYYLSQ